MRLAAKMVAKYAIISQSTIITHTRTHTCTHTQYECVAMRKCITFKFYFKSSYSRENTYKIKCNVYYCYIVTL